MFVASHSEALGRFNAAVQRRDLDAASQAARELAKTAPVSLHCALELTSWVLPSLKTSVAVSCCV